MTIEVEDSFKLLTTMTGKLQVDRETHVKIQNALNAILMALQVADATAASFESYRKEAREDAAKQTKIKIKDADAPVLNGKSPALPSTKPDVQ